MRGSFSRPEKGQQHGAPRIPRFDLYLCPWPHVRPYGRGLEWWMLMPDPAATYSRHPNFPLSNSYSKVDYLAYL